MMKILFVVAIDNKLNKGYDLTDAAPHNAGVHKQ
jgi:hypothetical protein